MKRRKDSRAQSSEADSRQACELPAEATGLEHFHPLVARWFRETFACPTEAQRGAWEAIARRASTLLLAPTGSGKTLAAFLVAIDRLAFADPISATPRVHTLYISPLKALGVDIARNLRAPLDGLRSLAEREQHPFREPTIGIRSGDTPTAERNRLQRSPPDILITTPESLFLLLTSRARAALASVETVIVDEIHAMAATKRGAHLFVSLERLESLRRSTDPAAPPLQRIGLSATQRPLDEIARLLGGADIVDGVVRPRPVDIVAASSRKTLRLSIETPLADLLRANSAPPTADSESAKTAAPESTALAPSLWPALHPRLVELIRAHRGTLVFVNSRRLAERIAAAVNAAAGEELALAHHGSLAKETRLDIEERLKAGRLPALIATSSLELGIDVGTIDLVVQIESPPSIAAGLQRVGRAAHHVGGVPAGIVFPKYRGDLLACAAAAARMLDGAVEETFYPRNPLDVLAQQLVAMVASRSETVDVLYDTVRRAAPFHDLPRSSFIGVLEMLAGRYPSQRFSELKPRVVWDPVTHRVTPRQGALRVAIANAGTIPDRGLYGVFLAEQGGDSKAGEPRRGGRRVGELDEEMVFETAIGDVFLLGASSWRVVEITADRVLVSPAPGEPGRMPFWRGEGPGRPLEFGLAIGELTRRLLAEPPADAERRLREQHGLRPSAAEDLVAYVRGQAAVTGEPPSDQTVLIECFRDEAGDWRVALMAPLGARIFAPWATAALTRLRADVSPAADAVWSDDGIVFRLPASDLPPPIEWLVPRSDEVEAILVRELAGTSLFAARFRENAGRALLLPRRQLGRRTPLWLQRRRAADLLEAVAQFTDFPILLETYREILRDVFDLPALRSVLERIEQRRISTVRVETRTPSPFANSLLFDFAGHFIYSGDTPLAERRAQALLLDQTQLRQLLGGTEPRDLLDPEVVATTDRELQRLDGRFPPRHADDLHDLLRRLGDLDSSEIAARCAADDRETGRIKHWIQELVATRRVAKAFVGGDERWIAAEDATSYREALGAIVSPTDLSPTNLSSPELSSPELSSPDLSPTNLASTKLSSPDLASPDRSSATGSEARTLGDWTRFGAAVTVLRDPLGDLLERFARTRGPFTAMAVADRFGIGVATAVEKLRQLEMRGVIVSGWFTPQSGKPGTKGSETATTPVGKGADGEWCGTEVSRLLRQRSLARARAKVAPVDQASFVRFRLAWQGLDQPRRGSDGLLDVIEQLQGLPLPMSTWEEEVLPTRVAEFEPEMLDELCAAGEVVWRGVSTGVSSRSNRVVLFLTDDSPRLAPPSTPLEGDDYERLRSLLRERGALFFDQVTRAFSGFPNDWLERLWELVWNGEVTNDTLAPLRSRQAGDGATRSWRGSRLDDAFRSRRQRRLPGSEGRWWLFERGWGAAVSATERQTALAAQLLKRYGVVTREAIMAEDVPGGYAALYPVFKAFEEAGRVHRGYFVADLGATQFAAPGADQRLRLIAELDAHGEKAGEVAATAGMETSSRAALLAALDPANPFGTALPFPIDDVGARCQRVEGAKVVLREGRLVAYLSRGGQAVWTFEAADERFRVEDCRVIAQALASLATRSSPVFLSSINGALPGTGPLEPHLLDAGFIATAQGYLHRRRESG